MGVIWREPRRRQIAAAVGLSLLSVYVGWNVWFVWRGQVPPSLLTGLTGLPCPTTGGTRSLMALLRGDVAASLYFNPMTVPIVGLLAVTMVAACRRCAGVWLARAWFALLLVAWVIKLLSPPGTW